MQSISRMGSERTSLRTDGILMLDNMFELSRRLVRVLDRPYRRYFIRTVALKARCSILVGQRGVGKTTTLVQHLVGGYPDHPSSRECLYLPVDHFAVAQAPLYEIAHDFAQQGGKLLCLDEIHKYPSWSRDLKSIHDTFPELQVVASGSSMLRIHEGTHDLSRRAIVYQMTGMSFREFLEIRLVLELPVLDLGQLVAEHETRAAAIVAQLGEKGVKVLSAFRDYLRFGFYPYFFEYEDPGLFRMTLEQNMRTTVESDLPAVQPNLNGNSVSKIRKLLAVVASSVPFTPDLVSLRKLLDIADDRTLKTYLRHLEEAGLLMAVTKSGRGLAALEKPDRIYLGDPNQIYAVQPEARVDLGNVRETFFCRMVSPAHTVRSPARGDFCVDEGFSFEVGGRSKGGGQIAGQESAFLALDDIETGVAKRIPLWLFGFLY
ncbi:MAG: 3-dehydroquinate dehydratase [Armatimonadetes bacterium CG_4_10_14_3_um_filter_66_18]|nr:MAG: 3-dehydroquinate dehydratase [Armatimonadetes bacterium CG06_land_8_20_14_3_00_66_21]PIW19804.1 MAG: 3-dehydroquinate dehydratase [Armatimonadetes bacterium CG17_big_fil_post_rev_8_21_14_2_50_66_6]PIX46706.1 MAG: 3-dehydroquinate dehydratase [Armatimonadetes bacterium CG_4_8_14_3_um_filter_66_20]PIY41468.1 MAG: 3-dehydroquinate dehydratase [Armatimonadetes bacterium CG_4_10_14_3_um_filter_66_18]PIZ40854.1 MAG: 3-dehydroquinate dehydratase [Armatimonadetes bacterium CG_4_10_14_0_8_um_fil